MPPRKTAATAARWRPPECAPALPERMPSPDAGVQSSDRARMPSPTPRPDRCAPSAHQFGHCRRDSVSSQRLVCAAVPIANTSGAQARHALPVPAWQYAEAGHGLAFKQHFRAGLGAAAPALARRSIGRRIIEGHGGHLWAASEPGRGSPFHFTVPAVSTPDLARDLGGHDGPADADLRRVNR